MLSALSAAKKRTQPPLRPTDIRLILVIRDPLIHFSPFQEISFILGENGRVSLRIHQIYRILLFDQAEICEIRSVARNEQAF